MVHTAGYAKCARRGEETGKNYLIYHGHECNSSSSKERTWKHRLLDDAHKHTPPPKKMKVINRHSLARYHKNVLDIVFTRTA